MHASKWQAPEDDTPSASQAKQVQPGKDALASAGQGLEAMTRVLQQSITALSQPPAPSTPSRTGRGTLSTVESSPVCAQNAIAHASTLELEHLEDAAQVMKFICFLKDNDKAIITYNALVKAGNTDLWEAYVKECIRKYEAAEEKKDLGL